jgi:hypothetical protein
MHAKVISKRQHGIHREARLPKNTHSLDPCKVSAAPSILLPEYTTTIPTRSWIRCHVVLICLAVAVRFNAPQCRVEPLRKVVELSCQGNTVGIIIVILASGISQVEGLDLAVCGLRKTQGAALSTNTI